MNRRAVFPALLAIFLLLPGFAHAQTTPSTANRDLPARLQSIRGNVRFEQNVQSAEMVKVELRKFSGEIAGVTFTRSNGEFEFAGLYNGTFYVVVEETGYEPVRQAVQIYNSSQFGVLVYLKKISTGAPAEGGDSVSVRELSLPRDARSTFRKGMDVLYKKHDPAASLPLFEKVATAAPNFYEALFRMGIAYDQLQKPVEAEAAWRKSIAASEEKFPDAFIALASLLTTLERAAEAEALARRALDLDPTMWQGQYEMGRALAGLNRQQEAEKSLMESVRLHNDYPPAYLLLANVHMRMRKQTALLGDLNEFLRLDPNGPQSDQARKMRDSVQRELDHAKNSLAAPPKP
jgi:tetratricopeptide (TPR) repeat protein